MRTPGLNLGFMQILSAGPQPNPTVVDGAIGTSFFTPVQAAFRNTRRKYGSLDDPDAGGYSLAQIDWDKESGACEVGHLEPTSEGWLE